MSDRRLRLQIVLNAVDKLTRPFQGASAANKRLAETIKQSRQHLRDLNQQAGKIDGFRKTKQALTSAQEAYRNATDRVAALSRVINASSNPTQAQRRELQQAMRAAGQLKDKTQHLSQSLQRQREVLSASGISTRNLGEAQRQLNRDINRTTQTLQQQQQQLERLNRQQQRMAAAKARYQQMKDVRNQMAATGATATAAGVGALYGAKRVMLPGYDFEVGMSNVQALTRLDKNAPELKTLREQARHLGATTSFTANDVAGGMGFLAMAGYDPDKIQKSMPAMLDLAKAASMDDSLAEVADIASNIQSAYKIPADEMKRVADVLTYGFTTSNTDLRKLGETMAYVGPVAQAAGQDFESMVAMVGMLGNVGIQGSRAGTATAMAMTRMATQPSEAKKALKALGISIGGRDGKMKQMPQILSEIQAAFKKKGINDVGNVKKIAYIKEIFGQDAFAAIAELIDRQGALEPEKRIDAYIKKLHEQKDTSSQVAKAKADNLDGDVKNLRSAWEDVGITLYDSVREPLRDIAQQVTEIMRSLGEWAKANPELTKKLTLIGIGLGVVLVAFGAITLAVVALLGPLALAKLSLSVLGIKGAGSLKLLGGAFKILAGVIRGATALMMANPILAILGMIALAAWLIYDNWDTLVPWFRKLWASISGYVSTAWQNIKQTLLNKWEEIKQDTQNKWDGIKKTLGDKWDEIVEDTKKLPEKFKQFGTEIIDKLIAGIQDKWKTLKQSIANLGTEIKDAITPDFMKTQAHKPDVKQALAAYNTATSPAAGFFGGAFDRGGYLPTGKVGLVGEHGPELINGPVRVTSRRQTASLARMAATALSMGAASTVSAQPLHPYSLPATQYQSAGVTVIHQPPRSERPVYEIHIHATAFQSEQDIARAVARELDRREHQQRARARSAYADREEF